MDLLEHKVFVLYLNGESLSLQAIPPINSDECEELSKQEERGLVKFLVVDASSSYLLHKSVVHKMVHNLLTVDDPDLEFVDQSVNSRRIIQIKARDVTVRECGFITEDYEHSNHEDKNRFTRIKKRYLSIIRKLKRFKPQQPISQLVKRSA
jgi:hypothetical protein